MSTPVVELEGFKRVPLKKGETKTVTFDLTPYQLSLLDANMVRRVEPGVFRIHVGGCCPDVPKGVHDDRKNKVGFFDPLQGITGEFTEPKEYSAQFTYTLDVPDKVGGGQPFPATLTVKNEGNLTDVTEAKLYAGFELGSWGFELNPGETKTHVFQPTVYKTSSLAVIAGSQMVEKEIAVEKAPGRLELKALRLNVDNNDVLQVTGEAQNVGGDLYDGVLALKVDGNPVGENEPLKLQAGEKRHVALGYTFAVSGVHRVQVGDEPEQQIVVPGGLGLGLQNPLVYLKLGEGQGTTVKNEITGKDLNLVGTPAWVDGKDGKALQLAASGQSVNTGSLDIYRKAFTLSAWVKIDALGKGGDLALFGGKAPMGADQDTTGTQLHVGIHNKKPFMGFLSRDISGAKEVPLGTWINLSYTYDPLAEKGSLYLNGSLDKSIAQKPYTGPLEMIGDAPVLEHGNYALGQTVVTQSCLTPQMIHQLSEKGFESLRQGDYTSQWRTFSGTPATLDATADVPDGSSITVTVETGSADGKTLSSAKVELKAGQQTYPLSGLTAGTQVRLRVQVSSTAWSVAPVLRAATITGDGGKQKWSTPNEWAQGQLSPSLVTGFSQ